MNTALKSAYEDDDLNDYERQQDAYGDVFEDAAESENEDLLSPYKEPYRLENWSFEDLVMFVGGDKELYR